MDAWPSEKIVWLYKDGDECVGITGGWELTNMRSGGWIIGGTLTKYSDKMILAVAYNARFTNMSTVNTIEAFVGDKLYIEIEGYSSFYQIRSNPTKIDDGYTGAGFPMATPDTAEPTATIFYGPQVTTYANYYLTIWGGTITIKKIGIVKA